MNPKMLTSEASDYLNISLPGLHKQLKSKNLEYTKNKNKLYFSHETAKEIFKLDLNPTCISWQNLKGGVGKTHISFSVAIRLCLYGAKVALIDIDPQGNCTSACGIDAEDKPVLIDIITQKLNILDCMCEVVPGLDLLPSRIDNVVLDNVFAINGLPVDKEIKKRTEILKENYDFVFIDCPSSLGQTVTSACLSVDHILIPCDPEKFSLSGVNITLNEIEKNIADKYDKKFDIKILLNKFDGRTSLSHSTLSKLHSEDKYKTKTLKSFVRTSQEFPNAIDKGKTIYDPLKNSTAKEDIDLLARELIDMAKKDKIIAPEPDNLVLESI